MCESCGHEYRTTVRWLQSFAGSKPPEDDTEPLPSERHTLPAWSIPIGLRQR
jgi:hypothetical protein